MKIKTLIKTVWSNSAFIFPPGVFIILSISSKYGFNNLSSLKEIGIFGVTIFSILFILLGILRIIKDYRIQIEQHNENKNSS